MPPTFFHTNGTVGRPDLSIVSNNEIAARALWEVLEEESLSDHQYIKLEIHLERKTMTFVIFKTKYGGHSKFHRNLRQYAHQALEDLCNCNNKEDLEQSNQ
ncbi:hypothetical protein AVEN_94697-1 [Araneus ventricosus]|uniref:Endonuclease/exonuclease/phosphatase domain-containing protein n=1 Tax=Araneus ventricosus TaxID=182803 RepID=A0A4Y2CLU1_ARAVE|nr:hypothetical protein AVEN_94697-1 [Araneus ventricosus]